MGNSDIPEGLSANLRKAVCWISETVQEYPEKSRRDIVHQAELKFDLTPRECEFLNTHFADIINRKC